MDNDDKKQSDQFDAALPLPIDSSPNKTGSSREPSEEAAAAADLIRKKVQAAYGQEPSAAAEARDLEEVGAKIKRSRHQQFIYELTSSGKPLHEIQIAWHEYYAGLSDREKHEVWNEFYRTHAQASHFIAEVPGLKDAEGNGALTASRGTKEVLKPILNLPGQRFRQARRHTLSPPPPKAKLQPRHHLQSLLFGLSVGAIVLLIFLFSFFNERFIAPFIQPSRNISNTPIITSGGTVGPDPEIVIPKINVEIPVVYTVTTIDEAAVDKGLENGVVHYADTAMPGQNGNVVIVGHSSNNIFNPGRYKFAFVLLNRLESGDTFYLTKDGKRYTYQVYKRQIVSPTDVSVLGPADKPATVSLITCDPPGTSINRLVVTAEQIDPSPSGNTAQSTTNNLAKQSSVIPGNSPSLWSRILKWLAE